MANTFKSYTKANISTTLTDAYTVPGSTTTVCIGINVSNTSGNQILVDIKFDKAAGGADDIYLIRNMPIPSGASYEFIAGSKLVMETGDKIQVLSDTANSVDSLISVLEQT